jgi:hypothetical protein
MKQLKSIWIGLGDGEITDAGAQELLNINGLEELDLQDYSISSEMQDRLKEMPNLKGPLFVGQNFNVGIVPSWVRFPRRVRIRPLNPEPRTLLNEARLLQQRVHAFFD